MIKDYTSRDFASMKSDLISQLKIIAPELTNTNESEFAIVIIDLFCYIGDLLSYSIDIQAIETYLPTARQRKNVTKIVNLMNYKLENSKPSKVNLTLSIDDAIQNDIIIPAKTICYTEGENSISFETDEICIIEAGETSTSAFSSQGLTKYETLGYSNGDINQTYTILGTNILDGVEIYCGNEEYKEVNTFIASNYNSEHFMLDNSETNSVKIIFGNGLNAKIPPANSRILAIYRVGSGIDGNVGANTITKIKGQISDSENNLINVKVNNEFNATNGKDIESIESAKIHAPAQQYTLWRAVTEEDFEKLALTQKDISQSKVILDDENEIVNIYVRLKNDDEISQERLYELNEFYKERTLIGVKYSVHSAEFLDIGLNINIKLFPHFSNEELKQEIVSLISNSEEINNLKFGELPSTGLIIKKIMEINGVMNADVSYNEITIKKYQIAKLSIHVIDVFGGV